MSISPIETQDLVLSLEKFQCLFAWEQKKKLSDLYGTPEDQNIQNNLERKKRIKLETPCYLILKYISVLQ